MGELKDTHVEDVDLEKCNKNENDLENNENKPEMQKDKVEFIIESIQNEEIESDWEDSENEGENVNENQFKDLVQSFGSVLKIQIENKFTNLTQTPTQPNKDSNEDDDT